MPSPRESAGAIAPAALASSPAALPHFEKRSAPAPEIPGISDHIAKENRDSRPPSEILADLDEARTFFGTLRAKGEQTRNDLLRRDGAYTNYVLKPLLNAENARAPGLNAVEFSHDEKMAKFLRDFSSPDRDGQEGHIRCHVGFRNDNHRVAVDAFKHREGGFTLVAVDSVRDPTVLARLPALEQQHPDLIKGILIIPTPNQLHFEGCRIFALHTLNAMHDYQPHLQNLHRQIYAKAQGRPAPGLSGPEWKQESGNVLVHADATDALGMLPGKFFKHMQMKKPAEGSALTLLAEAELRYPALKVLPVNKKGQTLRERINRQNPQKAPEEFSRPDCSASLDIKRLILIDRAIAYYQKQYGADRHALPPESHK